MVSKGVVGAVNCCSTVCVGLLHTACKRRSAHPELNLKFKEKRRSTLPRVLLFSELSHYNLLLLIDTNHRPQHCGCEPPRVLSLQYIGNRPAVCCVGSSTTSALNPVLHNSEQRRDRDSALGQIACEREKRTGRRGSALQLLFHH